MKNYNDMTIEEKIKEAWGEYWNFFCYLTQQRILSNNGSVDYFLLSKAEKEDTEILLGDIRKLECTKTDEGTKRYFRPNSLRGIENNNGWIKIESEDDLPKDGNFWIRKSDGLITLMSVLVLKSIPKKRHSEITHYRPIEKPKPPLY